MDNDEYLAALRFCAGPEDPTVKFIQEEAMESDPECPICGGLGWVAVDEDGETDVMESEDSMRCPACAEPEDGEEND